MKDVNSLQIDVRCVKCSRLSSTDVILYEMRNHLFICSSCRQEAEQQGKQIAWAPNESQADEETNSAATAQPRTRILPPTLPPDSVFARLKLPLDAPIADIEDAIDQAMKTWLRAARSSEKSTMIELLHAWQEKVEDAEDFEVYRKSLQPQRKGNALSVGGRSVLTAKDFVVACEASADGWADGERYLRMGQLKLWALYQLSNRTLATTIGEYQARDTLSNFRALNEVAYLLDVQRPFRLYEREQWQALQTLVSAHNPQELAFICDHNWSRAETHLYQGSMIFWLEYAHGIQGLHAYFVDSLMAYENKGARRGTGLELLLERAMPTLEKPQLQVTFNGEEHAYAINNWDRELLHQPVKIAVRNTTRGFVNINLALKQDQKMEPNWLALPSDSILLAGRPGHGFPATAPLTFNNLANLNRGRKYQRELSLNILRESGKVVHMQNFPITISTLRFYQGLRGKLWLWGLRGGPTAFFWNTLSALLLSLLALKVLPLCIPQSWYTVQVSSNLLTILCNAMILATQQITDLGLMFPPIYGLMIGLVSFFVGMGRGHMNDDARRNARIFRNWTFYLGLITIILLVCSNNQTIFINQALSSNRPDILPVIGPYLLGDLIFALLFPLMTLIIIRARSYLENFLRKRYATLLDVPGKM